MATTEPAATSTTASAPPMSASAPVQARDLGRRPWRVSLVCGVCSAIEPSCRSRAILTYGPEIDSDEDRVGAPDALGDERPPRLDGRALLVAEHAQSPLLADHGFELPEGDRGGVPVA